MWFIGLPYLYKTSQDDYGNFAFETTLGGAGGDLTSVNLELAAWLTNSNNLALLLENSDSLSGKRSVDLNSLGNNRWGDELSLGDFLGELVP